MPNKSIKPLAERRSIRGPHIEYPPTALVPEGLRMHISERESNMLRALYGAYIFQSGPQKGDYRVVVYDDGRTCQWDDTILRYKVNKGLRKEEQLTADMLRRHRRYFCGPNPRGLRWWATRRENAKRREDQTPLEAQQALAPAAAPRVDDKVQKILDDWKNWSDVKAAHVEAQGAPEQIPAAAPPADAAPAFTGVKTEPANLIDPEAIVEEMLEAKVRAILERLLGSPLA